MDNETNTPNEEQTSRLQQPAVSEALLQFIDDIELMRSLYKNQKYTRAENLRDKLAQQLDDIMCS